MRKQAKSQAPESVDRHKDLEISRSFFLTDDSNLLELNKKIGEGESSLAAIGKNYNNFSVHQMLEKKKHSHLSNIICSADSKPI